ncbi:MAG: hypothetical protein AAFQ85_07860 [Pseudomonadota bacterium]
MQNLDTGSVPAGTPRQLRIFFSHRHHRHGDIYKQAIAVLREHFGQVQDLSIPEDRIIAGPRGGSLPDFKLRSQIAARIYESDIFVAPSSVAMGIGEWTSYEIECAAFAYSQPILFVDEPDQQRSATLVAYIRRHIENCGVVTLGEDGGNIAQAVIGLIRTREIKSQPAQDRAARNWHSARTPEPEAMIAVRTEFPYLQHDGARDVRDDRMWRRRRRG